jgi:iron complex outermembrane receptor protein
LITRNTANHINLRFGFLEEILDLSVLVSSNYRVLRPDNFAWKGAGSRFQLCAAFLLLSVSLLFCQHTDSIPYQLQEVTVTAYRSQPSRYIPLNIQSIQLNGIEAMRGFNLSEILTRTEGVSMLTTGVGIAKPVIRGLYGNRVLVLLNGLKFDNQQWQEEHGLGLTSFGLDRVELIKGPIGTLYGTEAIGGVVNLIEEKRALPNTEVNEYSLTLNSNTLGGMVQAAYKKSSDRSWWRLRIGADNNADYSDGNKHRVLNSRFDGYFIKATYGFQRKNWISSNNYAGSYNRFGFIFNDVYDFIKPDPRWSRKLSENPYHLVLLNTISSENRITLRERYTLNLNLGAQSNERMENEGGGAISLNMHLLTLQILSKLEYRIDPNNKIIFSNLNVYEDNTNFGSRKIVPDAHMFESNLSANYETQLDGHFILENGAGIGKKWIKTFFTPGVNGQGKEVQPFEKQSPYFNFFSGFSFLPSDRCNMKLNLATGVRMANLAELSSNGLHEGVFTYEIGDPDLRNEKVFAINYDMVYRKAALEFSISPFYNHFKDYIFLKPADEQWFGFPVSRYEQQDCDQWGIEATFGLKINDDLAFKVGYSGMNSKTRDGNFTPYIPAQKVTPSIHYRFTLKPDLPLECHTNVVMNFAQNNTAPFEIATPQYSLWNAGMETHFGTLHKKYAVGIEVNNILNRAYYDHLSRFKNFDLLNIGRNVVMSVKINS